MVEKYKEFIGHLERLNAAMWVVMARTWKSSNYAARFKPAIGEVCKKLVFRRF